MLECVEEVEASLATSARGRKREALLEGSAGWAVEALRRADVVYHKGLNSLVERLEAEAAWLGARLELVTAREKGFSAAVALHKARILLPQVVAGPRTDSVEPGPPNSGANADPSVAATTPSALPSSVMDGTAMTGCATTRARSPHRPDRLARDRSDADRSG